MTGYHCDAADCQTWASKKAARKVGFVSVRWERARLHFCSWDCVLRYAAAQHPLTVGGER